MGISVKYFFTAILLQKPVVMTPIITNKSENNSDEHFVVVKQKKPIVCLFKGFQTIYTFTNL
jgi:hypothetical protein